MTEHQHDHYLDGHHHHHISHNAGKAIRVCTGSACTAEFIRGFWYVGPSNHDHDNETEGMVEK